MDKEQVAAAKARAEEVVNGFKRVSDRIARDAVRLAETIEAKDRMIEALEKKLAASAFVNASKAASGKGVFEEMFGQGWRQP